MERHFILPVTLAAAVHAGLLFGIRGNPAVPPHGDDKIVLGDPLPDPIKVFFWSEPDSEDSAPAIGAPVNPAPSAPEPPPPDHPPGFTIEVPARTPISAPDMRTIPNGPIGVPDGLVIGTTREVGNILRIIDLDNTPRVRLQTAPVYPMDAKRNGLPGDVLVEFTVDEQGMVVEPRVVHSSDRVFEEATLRAVSRWRFEPGRRAGQIVRFRMAVPVVYHLDEN